MPDHYFTDEFCIETPEGGNIMENLPATFWITDAGASLSSFQIGAFKASREMAVVMSGEEHIARQERNAFDRWCAEANDFWAGVDQALEAAE